MLDKILMSEDILCILPLFMLAAMFGIGIVYTIWQEIIKWWRE